MRFLIDQGERKMEGNTDNKLPEEVELFIKELKEAYEENRGIRLIEERHAYTENSFCSLKRYKVEFLLRTDDWNSEIFSLFCEVIESTGGYALRISHNFMKYLLQAESGDLSSIQHRGLKIKEFLDNFRNQIDELHRNAVEAYVKRTSLLEYIQYFPK